MTRRTHTDRMRAGVSALALAAVALLAAAGPWRTTLAQNAPTGPAGGDLAGDYPNPTLRVDRVRKAGDSMTGTLGITLPNPGTIVIPFTLSSPGNPLNGRGLAMQFNVPWGGANSGLGGQLTTSWGANAQTYMGLSAWSGSAFSEIFRVDGRGLVGINAPGPLGTLHVRSVANSHSNLYIDAGTDGFSSALNFSDVGVGRASIQHNPTVAPSGLVFQTGGLAAPVNTRMVITAAGNVGVGTTAPGFKFDVAGSLNAAGLCIAGDCKTSWSQVTGTSSQWATSGANIYYNAGNVGIGTTAPTNPLHINNASGMASMRLSGSGLSAINFKDVAAPADAKLYQWRSEGGLFRMSLINDAENNFAVQNILVANGAGNVGIGTGSPSNRLHVHGGNVFHQWSATASHEYGFFTSINNNHLASNLMFDGQWKMMTAGKGAYAVVGPFSDLAFSVGNDNTARAAGAAANLTPLFNVKMDGKVGIGTSTPATKLHVADIIYSQRTGEVGFQMYNGGSIAEWAIRQPSSTDHNLYFTKNVNGAKTDYMMISTAGSVGVGTAAPTQKLDVAGNVNAAGLCIAGDCKTSWSQLGGGTTGGGWTDDGTAVRLSTASDSVGIGTSTPSQKLHVLGGNIEHQFSTTHGLGYGFYLARNNNHFVENAFYDGTTWRAMTDGRAAIIQTYTAGGNALFVQADDTPRLPGSVRALTPIFAVKMDGKVGVGTITPAEKLHVVGNVVVDGNISAKYQDVAEWVPSTQKLQAGTVVVLDTANTNHVLASTASYDTGVAGVVSEQPGIILGEGGEGKVKVATTGRVRVRVDATRGAVKIGDLLVTSDTPGLAMRSEPVVVGGRRMHAPGTIIGKALEPLEKGTGEILVLLSMQ